MEYKASDQQAIKPSVSDKQPKKKRKWLLNTLFALALGAVAIIGWLSYRQPQLKAAEFTFSYGSGIPVSSRSYFSYGRQYEDVSFESELAAVKEIGDYEIKVMFAQEAYTLIIHVVDDKAPIITFSDRDSINLYSYAGEKYLDPIYTISEDSDYKISITPSLREMKSGEQDICVTAVDAYANENTRCKTFDVWKIEPNLVKIPKVDNVADLVKQYIAAHQLNTANFGFYYYSVDDEESYVYNPDTPFYAASIVKVPLNMVFEDRYVSGEMHPQDTIALLSGDVESGAGNTLRDYKINERVPYAYLQEQCIVNSDNTATNTLVRALGGFGKYRHLIAAYSEHDLPANFALENVISMNYMLDVMKHLYRHADRYQTLIDHMKQASVGEFLQASSDMFEIAQKYGDYANNLHATGIVYTPQPYIVGIYTYRRSDANALIKELNEWLIAYQFQKSLPAQEGN